MLHVHPVIEQNATLLHTFCHLKRLHVENLQGGRQRCATGSCIRPTGAPTSPPPPTAGAVTETGVWRNRFVIRSGAVQLHDVSIKKGAAAGATQFGEIARNLLMTPGRSRFRLEKFLFGSKPIVGL